MNMTHYMELLATNQPWNLLIFMAVPMLMAEALAIAEMYLLYTKNMGGKVAKFSKVLGIIVGIYFAIAAIYLIINVALPLTTTHQWRTIIDVIAVWAYIISALPMAYIGLMRLGVIARSRDALAKLRLHSIAIACFLVFSHIAMIAGMTSPAVFGWQNPAPMQMEQMNMEQMPMPQMQDHSIPMAQPAMPHEMNMQHSH